MTKILTIILLFCTSILFAQSIAPKKCNTCGKSMAQCQYKGRHPKPTSGYENGHEWVDLGLSVKWATMNVGASSPSDYGDYYAWGDTNLKSSCCYDNYKYRSDSGYNFKFSKYVTDKSHGKVDGKKVLDLNDDVAYVNWGSSWRMPTQAQLEELIKNCIWTETSQNGHTGYKVTSKKNGNSIFLPNNLKGYRAMYGEYWSSSLELFNNIFAHTLNISNSDGKVFVGHRFRVDKAGVRPVFNR